jgi:DNA-binding NarL/FixJ family response regulator
MKLLLFDADQEFNDAVSRLLARRGHQVTGRLRVLRPAVDLGRPGETDAVVMDLRPGAVDGPDDVALLREDEPSLGIVVFTADTHLTMIRRALDRGADGVVLKREGVYELERVLLRIMSPWFQKLRRSAHPEKAWSPGARSLDRFEGAVGLAESVTPRERDVLEHLARGADTAAIATGLGLGESTIRSHLQSLFHKAGVHSRIELVAAAIRAGIVELEEAAK